MTFTVIAAVCVLLLLAYIFDLTSAKTRIPAVILLLTLGWGVRQLTDFAKIEIPDLTPVLPFFGTIGLILIVLEGSLELELERSKLPLIGKSIVGSFLPILALAFTIAYSFKYFGHSTMQTGLINALPFCIISSAIAISSVKSLSKSNKEFIIYESSLSDIFGVLIFNFLLLNDTISFSSFSVFIFQIVLMVLIAFVASLSLSFMLGRIEHHIKYAPVVILTILIYAVSEIYHLPALIFIMIFGMFAANLGEIKRSDWMKKFRPEVLEKEVSKLRELNTEGTFLIRSLFFLMFGFLIETKEVLNEKTLPWAFVIVSLILFFRIIQLMLSKLPIMPLLFIAPRGLITILLFISIPQEKQLPFVDKSLIIQVILISSLVMMTGLIFTRKSAIINKDSTDSK